MATYDPQLLKGILSMLLLKTLERDEDYGYSVVVRLQELGFEGLAEGTVYPALTRLEKRGLLASRLVPSDAGPARKYYRLTADGQAELSQAAAAWLDLSASVNDVMAAESQITEETTDMNKEST